MGRKPNITISARGLFKPAGLYFQELSVGFCEPDGVIVRGKCSLPCYPYNGYF